MTSDIAVVILFCVGIWIWVLRFMCIIKCGNR
jgi:hypothetical protein